MSVTVTWVTYGAAALAALGRAVSAAKASDPLAPVTVVVPSNQVGVAARRELGRTAGFIGVTFLTPYRLAELAGASALAAQGRRPVSTPVLAAAVRAELSRDAGVFAPVAAHPATESALVAAHRELRDLTDDELDLLARQSRRAGAVVALHRGVRRRLETHWYDEDDLITSAVASAAAMADELGSVVVYLPQRLSRGGARLLTALSEPAGLSVIAGTVGVAEADREVIESVRRLGSSAVPPAVAALGSVSSAATEVLTTSDSEDEVRSAVRRVIDAARAGTPLDRIAVLHASAQPYARLLREQFTQAGVAVNGTADIALDARVSGRMLLGLLDLPAGGFRRHEVMAWLTESPIHHGGRPVPTSGWERLSRRAGVVSGRDHWDRLLANLADQLDQDATERAERRPDDDDDWHVARLRRDAERARRLREFVLDLHDELDRLATGTHRWGELARWARGRLDDLAGGDRARVHWPEVERRAADRVELALDRLAALDSVEGETTLAVFTRTLRVELESDLGRMGRFGDGVLVGPVSMGLGIHLDLVILVGMAEGSFPSTVRDDSLLPDVEREAADGALSLRRHHADRLHHQFLAVVAGASRQLLCVPRGDLRRSSERVPSRWVLDVASELVGSRWWSRDLLGGSAPWLTHIASFDHGLRRAPSPATEQEHRLRTLMSQPVAPDHLAELAGRIDPVLAAAVEVVDARRSESFTRFDGKLTGLAVPSPVDRPLSATRLERWASCPYAYMLRDLFGVEPIESPEDELTITPMDRGSLVHEVFERFILEVLARPAHMQPTPSQPWTPADHLRIVQIAEELGSSYERRGLTGRPFFWARDRAAIARDVDQFLTFDRRRRITNGCSPVAAEQAFGLDGTPPVAFPLDDGTEVLLRGKTDRVDLSSTGTIFVVDYKTGGHSTYAKLTAEDPHHNGTRLQLAVYALAARQQLGQPDATVRASYWFTSSKGKFKEIGYEVSDEVLAEVGRAIGVIVAGIGAGEFPHHPMPANGSPFNPCEYCDPEFLGTADLAHAFQRKISDPGVAHYAALLTGPVSGEAQ